MRNFLLSLLVAASIGGLVLPASAAALSLDEAKSQGLVGETPSGYLQAVSPSPAPAVSALVGQINQAREKKYQSIAQRRRTALQDVERLAGKTAIEKTPSGQFVFVQQRWQKK